jgi:hypothetical protein
MIPENGMHLTEYWGGDVFNVDDPIVEDTRICCPLRRFSLAGEQER